MERFCEISLCIGIGLELIKNVVKSVKQRTPAEAVGWIIGAGIGLTIQFFLLYGAGTFE